MTVLEMGTERAFPARLRPGRDLLKGLDGRVLERLRHTLWAGLIALLMAAAVLLDPLDQFIWLVQSRIGDHQPSGEIVFVGTDPTIADADSAARSELATAIGTLDRLGVGQIYLDLQLEPGVDAANDRALADAIAKLGPRIVLVDHIIEFETGKPGLSATPPSIAGGARRVADADDANWFGFVWEMPFSRTLDAHTYPSFGAALGGQSHTFAGDFPVNYGILGSSIPTLDFKELTASGSDSRKSVANLAGKTVVIGPRIVSGDPGRALPGQRNLPRSYGAIYAAETLRAGRTVHLGSLLMLLLTATLLAAAVSMFQTPRRKLAGYVALAAFLPALAYVTATLGIRVAIAHSIGMLVAYALIRWRAHWKQRVAMIDQDTGLPTLRALDTWMNRVGVASGHIVVAKVHGYEHVLRTLRTEDQSTYILRLADRLRAADKDLTVYFDGHYLGWHAPSDETDALVEHLEGMRAIFAAPIQVADHTVDVGITFGVARIDNDRARRIPAAIAAAEETSEATQPIKVAESGSHVDMLWDISLRARIDGAMEAGEIYCVYQPKVTLESGKMTGVEALVRWHDPERGFISPLHFIQQCEKAGRMEHLTRYVLQSACTAGKLLHFRGTAITMSVNISATLLGDTRIVGIVRNVLQSTAFEPASLMLEVTETARIPDLGTAAKVLAELKALGCRISIDDFGVGAANFETFFELPFDELKIDRLFISNIVSSAKARAIASSIIAMGREARIAVVAEGAETTEELAILKEIGCAHVQGFAISRPISLSNLLKFNPEAETERRRTMV